ncbi:S41 family peptidase [Pseudoflavitalea rhizosphaerae]|uniref:S41 family peptidase n=1 Tax=Pseudoflavitalea rhizosphaerae TaxID=1884793 RepID=UPI000F8C88F7|nr:S41 family peptidase [Pseudoflavitalea rhizosphaerae]
MMARHTRYIISLLTLLVLFLYSCKKETGSTTVKAPENFSEVFDQFWNNMNKRYVFWKEERTDWDEVHRKYKPLFDALDFHDAGDLKRSVQYFREMTANLMDGHYYIKFTHPTLQDSSVYPSQERKRRSPWYHNPYNYSKVVRYKLDPNYNVGVDNSTSVTLGTIRQHILYFSCSYFYLYDAYTSSRSNNVKPVLDLFFNELAKSPSPYKGVIIDLRGNGGGDISDLNFLMGRLTATPIAFGSTRYKTGAGRLEYTPWINSFITPLKGSKGVDIPVIALADNFSASLAESVTMAIQEMPNGKFIGESTWGANGPYASNEALYNAGPFELNGFMKVQTASAAFRNMNGSISESVGIVPDLLVPFDPIAMQDGRDPILEAALLQFE